MNNISKIALGTVQFGLDYGISNTNGKPNRNQVEQILNYALDNKINTLDTASAYGDSELQLGNYGVENFNVIGKFLPEELELGIDISLNKTLSNLQINQLYGYLAHRADSIDDVSWKKLNQFKEIGKIKKIGYSLQSIDEFTRLNTRGYFPDLVQVPFSYFDTRFRDLCIFLKEMDVEIHTRSTFLQGLFFLPPDELKAFAEVRSIILELQNKYKEKLAQQLLSYVLDQKFVDKVVIGVQSVSQLRQNISSLGLKSELNHLDFSISNNILNPALWQKK